MNAIIFNHSNVNGFEVVNFLNTAKDRGKKVNVFVKRDKKGSRFFNAYKYVDIDNIKSFIDVTFPFAKEFKLIIED